MHIFTTILNSSTYAIPQRVAAPIKQYYYLCDYPTQTRYICNSNFASLPLTHTFYTTLLVNLPAAACLDFLASVLCLCLLSFACAETQYNAFNFNYKSLIWLFLRFCLRQFRGVQLNVFNCWFLVNALDVCMGTLYNEVLPVTLLVCVWAHEYWCVSNKVFLLPNILQQFQ